MGIERTLIDVLERFPVLKQAQVRVVLCAIKLFGYDIWHLPRQFQCAVHRVRKVLPERGEQQWAIVTHPKVAGALDKVVDAVLARLECVRRIEVLVSEPLVVTRALRAHRGCVELDAEEKINGGLFVRI